MLSSANAYVTLKSADGGWIVVAQNGTVSSLSVALSLAATTPAGETTVAYVGYLVATGGTAPYSYSISAGSLPAGLSVNASTGGISGTPSATGSFSFTALVTDATSTTATIAALIVITKLSLVFIGGIQGYAIPLAGCALVATGGIGGYTYLFTSGGSALAAIGLSLNASTGIISGTPTALLGTYAFTAGVTDCLLYTSPVTAMPWACSPRLAATAPARSRCV